MSSLLKRKNWLPISDHGSWGMRGWLKIRKNHQWVVVKSQPIGANVVCLDLTKRRNYTTVWLKSLFFLGKLKLGFYLRKLIFIFGKWFFISYGSFVHTEWMRSGWRMSAVNMIPLEDILLPFCHYFVLFHSLLRCDCGMITSPLA